MISQREFSLDKKSDKDIHTEVGAQILRNYGKFLKHQDKTFYDLQRQFETFYTSKPSNQHLYPIAIDVTPHEDIHVLDIIESDNKILNKILAVFSSLCKEIHCLQQEAKER